MSEATGRTETTETLPSHQAQQPPAPVEKTKSKTEQISEVIAVFMVVALVLAGLLFVIYIVFLRGLGEAKDDLQIYASASQDGSKTVRGHVLDNWEPAKKTAVTAVASAMGNNEYALGTQLTDDQGAFEFKIAEKFPVESVRIHARREDSTAQVTIPIEQKTKIEPKTIASQATLWGIIVYFLISIILAAILPLFRTAPEWIVRGTYVTSLVLAVGFAFVIIYALYDASERITKSGSPTNEVVTLGFMNIYRAPYLQDDPQEDFFLSLTLPPPRPVKQVDQGETSLRNPPTLPPPGPVKQEEQTDKRIASQSTQSTFGAPLWVVVLSVIGAAFLTVLMVLKEIGTTLDIDLKTPEGRQRFRLRIQNVVQHQIFILFAPLGGIFLFQMMRVGKAAGEPLTVGLVALGAGASLNLLMAKAVKASQSWLEKSEKKDGGNGRDVVAETPAQVTDNQAEAAQTIQTAAQPPPTTTPAAESRDETS